MKSRNCVKNARTTGLLLFLIRKEKPIYRNCRPLKHILLVLSLAGRGAEQLSVGGAGNDDFILTLAAGSRDQDIVTDFASSDQIEIALSSANNTLETMENTDADKLEKLLELVKITTASNADHGHPARLTTPLQMIPLSPLPMARLT